MYHRSVPGSRFPISDFQLPGSGFVPDFDTEFRVLGDKPWPRNIVTHKGEHSSDAITDSTLHWFKTKYDKEKPFFICHQFKAPHDYFENAPRYQEYLADVEIPEPPTLYDVPETFGSIATRGHRDELLPHIGTSIGKRNPRRSYAVDLKERFPEELPADYDVAKLSERETPNRTTPEPELCVEESADAAPPNIR